MYKRFVSIFSAAIILSSLVIQPVVAEKILYEKVDSTIISKGVVHENIKKFTDDGWLNVNVLKVNLNDPYINLDSIFSEKGASYRSNLLDMTKSNNAIASINADFFSPYPSTNLAHSIGPVVKSGQIVSTATDIQNKATYSVFSLDKNNIPNYSNWFKNMKIVAPNGKSMLIRDLNKFGWYTFLYMYDSNWGPKTIGSSEKFPTLTEMIVADDKVKGFSIGKGPVDIPKNGYVICGDYDAGKFLKDNFKIGDTVKVNNKSIPNWNNLKMAIGGGTILVKDGQIPEFTHDIPGRNPRTALGTTKDNKTAILVTVDGRQVLSKGMTQQELAKLMIELGCYNAINFDGGGSTTMVTRDLDNELSIINSYSDPNPRPVINGVGVFTNAPKSSLKGLKIETIDTNIFLNSSRAFSVLGYDNYYNPYQIDQKSVKWTVQGIKGKFVDNIFYPTSTGKGKIIAEVNGVSTSLDVNILNLPIQLQVSPSNMSISQNPQWLNIVGVDKDGYTAFLDSRDVSFGINSIVNVTDNYVRSKNNRSGVVKVSFKGIYNYFSIGSSAPSIVLDNFEKNTDSFWSYPTEVGGRYSLSQNAKSGSNSGRLEFDFSTVEGTKGAYIKLNGNNGYNIDQKPSKLKLWVYSSGIYPSSIKAEITDSTDKIFRPTLASEINWNGWKELEISLPNDITYPAKIKKLYVVETSNDNKIKGELLFDDLTMINGGSTSTKLPVVRKVKDYKEKESQLGNSENSFRIAVNGDSKYNKDIFYFLNNDLRKNASVIAFTNGFDKESLSGLEHPYFSSKSGFNSYIFKNSLLIKLSSKNQQSIRKVDSTQWTKLFDTLKSNKSDSVFLFLDSPIWGANGFVDTFEADLLKDTLSEYKNKTGKNVWVIYSSDKSESTNIDGVKYLGVIDNASNNLSTVNYLLITVNDKNVTYQFKLANK